MNSSNGRESRLLPEIIFTTLLIFIFSISALGIVLIGGEVYKGIINYSDENYQLRTSLSYVATKVRQSDGRDMISIKEIDGLNVLVMLEKDDGALYEKWIYHRDGALWEAYFLSGIGFDTEDGDKIMDIAKVDIKIEAGSVKISAETDEGRTSSLSVALRTETGG